jgi:hypothetical protein
LGVFAFPLFRFVAQGPVGGGFREQALDGLAVPGLEDFCLTHYRFA